MSPLGAVPPVDGLLRVAQHAVRLLPPPLPLMAPLHLHFHFPDRTRLHTHAERCPLVAAADIHLASGGYLCRLQYHVPTGPQTAAAAAAAAVAAAAALNIDYDVIADGTSAARPVAHTCRARAAVSLQHAL